MADASEGFRAGAVNVPRERAFIVVALAAIAIASWLYTGYGAWAMADMSRPCAWMPPPAGVEWSARVCLLTFAMWAVMMVAMMVPAAAPTIVLFAAMAAGGGRGGARARVLAFVGGYLVVWAAFSVAATAAQWALHQAALLDPMMRGTSRGFAASMLILAGAYQFTPLKARCLVHCRSPLGFLLSRWREGAGAAAAMGMRHGAFCVGCCWALMCLLFALGVMDMRWVAALTAWVLVEKLAPGGGWFGRMAGIVCMAWGLLLIASLSP